MADDPIVTPDPEPDGVLEVDLKDAGAKTKVVPVSVLSAERDRVRQSERAKFDKESEPLKAKAALADQLQKDLETIRPYVDKLRAKPELMEEPKVPEQDAISTDEAEKFAKEFELYTAQGLDVARAKRLLVREKRMAEQVAQQVAQQVVGPVAQTTAIGNSKANFLWAANQRDASGRPLCDPTILAQQWAQLPPESTADPTVAQFMLNAAIGETLRQGKQPAAPPSEPMYSEPSGGRRGPGYAISPMEQSVARHTGMSEKQWTEAATKYVPGQTNVIGD
jgi:hypothetical protein